MHWTLSNDGRASALPTDAQAAAPTDADAVGGAARRSRRARAAARALRPVGRATRRSASPTATRSRPARRCACGPRTRRGSGPATASRSPAREPGDAPADPTAPGPWTPPTAPQRARSPRFCQTGRPRALGRTSMTGDGQRSGASTQRLDEGRSMTPARCSRSPRTGNDLRRRQRPTGCCGWRASPRRARADAASGAPSPAAARATPSCAAPTAPCGKAPPRASASLGDGDAFEPFVLDRRPARRACCAR